MNRLVYCLNPWLFFLAFLSTVIVTTVNAEARSYDFQQLLIDGGLTLEPPANYAIQPADTNPVLSYEYALQHKQKKLAVRYAIRPINMVDIDYQDPHNSAPEPNHLFPMLFQSLISDFSTGGSSPSNEYSPADARTRYNADWAAVAVMDVTPEFSTEYSQILLLALHKNNASDAYMMILFDDYKTVKQEIKTVMNSLKYK